MGRGAHVLALDSSRNQIYVTNEGSGDVSIIDGDTDTLYQTYRVGGRPAGINVEGVEDKPPSAYISNEIQNMPVRHVDIYNNKTDNICLFSPPKCNDSLTPAPESPYGGGGAQRGIDGIDGNLSTRLIYVANPENGIVSVINGKVVNHINVPGLPADVAFDNTTNLVYVTDVFSDALYVINDRTNRVAANIGIINTNTSFKPDADAPPRIAISPVMHMIYATDPLENLVYWINTTRYLTNPEKLVSAFQRLPAGINLNSPSFGIDTGPPIHVGKYPTGISVDNTNRWVYVANTKSGTISVINGKTNKVVVGVNFNIQPSGSGDIDCKDGKKFSTIEYARIDIGTGCTAEPNGASAFSSWSVDLVSDPKNKSIATFYPTGYGTLTANFVSQTPLISTDQLYGLITGVIVGPIVGAIAGWLLPPRRP